MKPFNVICSFLATVSILSAKLEPSRTLEVGVRPESVCRGFDGKLFVTVMNSPDRPGDGVVRMIDGETITDFATGMDEPKGIAFVGGYLVVTDVTQVWKIDAQGKATILAQGAAFPHTPSFLNDTAASPDGNSVFVSDMGDRARMLGPNGLWPIDSPEAKEIAMIGRIYQIGLDGSIKLVIDLDPLMLNPNGVTSPEAGLFLVGEFFYGNILSHRDGKLTVLATGLRGADGIEKGDADELYISSWTQGKVWKLPAAGGTPELIIEGHKSAADFYLDRKEKQLILPDMLAGSLTFYQL